MAQARSDPTQGRVSRRHPFRDLALNVLLGAAILAACLAGFAWLSLTFGRGL